MYTSKPYYKQCIICGNISNEGKPQCFYCWSTSNIFQQELQGNLFTQSEYEELYDGILHKAFQTNNQKEKIELCNELIGLGFFSKNCYIRGIAGKSKFLSEKALNDAKNLLNNNLLIPDYFFNKKIDKETIDFRKKYPAEFRCFDGHYVRSTTEREIDNYLNSIANLKHEYEPKFRLTKEEKNICLKSGKNYEFFYPDFYIPIYNLYIEYFGKNDEIYNQKKDLKILILENRKNINFRYLSYNDNNVLLEKLEDILNEYKK